MIFKKIISNSSKRKGRVLYLMGATWHTKCMFDLDCDEDSFADILYELGIETYTFDNLPDSHKSNVELAIKLINDYNIDYILGYSYGCITACDVAQLTTIRGIMLLDPKSQTKVNKTRVADTFTLTKHDVDAALTKNSVAISVAMHRAHIDALSQSDTFTVPVYPVDTIGEHSRFSDDLLGQSNLRLFLTGHSTKEVQHWNPAITTYYPDSSHWILLEKQRYALAQDVAQFITTHKAPTDINIPMSVNCQ